LVELPGGTVLTGGIGGGGDVSAGVAPGSVAVGLLMGWLVHGSRSTGFFSSGLGIGAGSGVAAGGCTAEGASGMLCDAGACVCPLGVWLAAACPADGGT